MGLESYNFLLFNSENKCSLTDIGWEVLGKSFISFQRIRDEVLAIKGFKIDSLEKLEGNECFYVYNDNDNIIELEVNNGDYEEQVQEIAVRFAVCNPSMNYDKTISILRLLALKLDLSVLDMRLGEVIQFDNELSIRRSRASYIEKKREFFRIFNLSEEKFNDPLRCGSYVFDYIKNKLKR